MKRHLRKGHVSNTRLRRRRRSQKGGIFGQTRSEYKKYMERDINGVLLSELSAKNLRNHPKFCRKPISELSNQSPMPDGFKPTKTNINFIIQIMKLLRRRLSGYLEYDLETFKEQLKAALKGIGFEEKINSMFQSEPATKPKDDTKPKGDTKPDIILYVLYSNKDRIKNIFNGSDYRDKGVLEYLIQENLRANMEQLYPLYKTVCFNEKPKDTKQWYFQDFIDILRMRNDIIATVVNILEHQERHKCKKNTAADGLQHFIKLNLENDSLKKFNIFAALCLIAVKSVIAVIVAIYVNLAMDNIDDIALMNDIMNIVKKLSRVESYTIKTGELKYIKFTELNSFMNDVIDKLYGKNTEIQIKLEKEKKLDVNTQKLLNKNLYIAVLIVQQIINKAVSGEVWERYYDPNMKNDKTGLPEGAILWLNNNTPVVYENTPVVYENTTVVYKKMTYDEMSDTLLNELRNYYSKDYTDLDSVLDKFLNNPEEVLTQMGFADVTEFAVENANNALELLTTSLSFVTENNAVILEKLNSSDRFNKQFNDAKEFAILAYQSLPAAGAGRVRARAEAEKKAKAKAGAVPQWTRHSDKTGDVWYANDAGVSQWELPPWQRQPRAAAKKKTDNDKQTPQPVSNVLNTVLDHIVNTMYAFVNIAMFYRSETDNFLTDYLYKDLFKTKISSINLYCRENRLRVLGSLSLPIISRTYIIDAFHSDLREIMKIGTIMEIGGKKTLKSDISIIYNFVSGVRNLEQCVSDCIPDRFLPPVRSGSGSGSSSLEASLFVLGSAFTL